MTLILRSVIRLYQLLLSPLLGPRCRFYPTCSHYADQCLVKYCMSDALFKIGHRILRCHPFNPG